MLKTILPVPGSSASKNAPRSQKRANLHRPTASAASPARAPWRPTRCARSASPRRCVLLPRPSLLATDKQQLWPERRALTPPRLRRAAHARRPWCAARMRRRCAPPATPGARAVPTFRVRVGHAWPAPARAVPPPFHHTPRGHTDAAPAGAVSGPFCSVHSANKLASKHTRLPFATAAAKPERPPCDICQQARAASHRSRGCTASHSRGARARPHAAPARHQALTSSVCEATS